MAVVELPLAAAKLLILASMSGCPGKVPSPAVETRIDQVKTAYVTDRTGQELTASMTDRSNAVLGEHAQEARWMTGGIAYNQLKRHMSATVHTVQDKTNPNNICIAFKTLDFVFTHESEIHVATDFKQMGCRYSQIMAHERKHVQNYYLAASRNLPAMKQALRRHIQETGFYGPVEKSGINALAERMYKDANTALAPVYERIAQEAAKANARLDNYENYMKESALCPGQFPKFDDTPQNAQTAQP